MNEARQRIELLEKANIKTALLKLGLPTMVGMLVSAFYNIVDAFWVGRLGTLQTAAVSIVYPLTMVGIGVGMLFGSGANSCIARLLGKKEYEKVKAYSSTAIISGIGVITILVIGMLLFLTSLLNLLGATKDSFKYVEQYGLIFIIGLIFNVFNMMMNNIIVAEGNSIIGMTAMLIGGGVNLALDPVCIFIFDLGVSGAAIATLISQIISSALYVTYILRGKSYITFSPHYFKPAFKIYKEIFKIGLPICFFQILTGCAVSLTNIMARPFGEEAIAAMGIVNRIVSLESNALYGFFKGYSPLVGYNYGCGNMGRVKDATRIAVLWSTIANIIFGILCIIFAREFIRLFNQESLKVLDIGSFALRIDAVSYMTLGVQIVIGNYFLAIGKAKQGGLLSIFRQGLFFIPFLLIFSHVWGLTGLIISQIVADFCATFVTIIFWVIESKKSTATD